MKYSIVISLLVLLAVPASAQMDPGTSGEESEATRYISDNLFIYRHAGPGTNYRILGSFSAGTAVTQLGVSEDGSYIELVDANGRSGWVDANFVTDTPSIRLRLPELEQAAEQNQIQLQASQDRVNQLEQEMLELERQKQILENRLAQQQQELASAQQVNASLQKEQRLDWYLKGGGAAIGALLLGVLLTYLPKKRKRNDQWM